MSTEDMNRVIDIYNETIAKFDKVLVGEQNVKKIVSAALLCDANTKMLFMGDIGAGKTTLANFIVSSFNARRISITSDMLPSDIQKVLIGHLDLNLLQIDEFNRVSGKVQTALLELLEERQITFDDATYYFNNLYILATQNDVDIAGLFNVSSAIYDRIDIVAYFESLTSNELQQLLFGGFKSDMHNKLCLEDLAFVRNLLDEFVLSDKDIELMLKIIEKIDKTEYKGDKIFSSTNIRAHKFTIKLAKINALVNGRNFILPCDIADVLINVYKHRINQNILQMNEAETDKLFENLQDSILSLKRKLF